MGSDVRPWLEVFAKAAISAIPYAGGSLVIVAEQIGARRAQAANAFAADVAERAGVGLLGQALADDPVLEALFMRGVESAVNTGLVAKRRLLARVIASAVLDDAKVDESHLYAEALRDLDAPHLRALERFRRAVDAPIPFGAVPFGLEAGLREVWDGEPFPVRATLIRTGCSAATIVPLGPTGGATLGSLRATMLTAFGRDLLNNVRDEDTDDQVIAWSRDSPRP